MATGRKPRKTTKKPRRDDDALSPAEEYREALADFNTYWYANETPEFYDARARLREADRKRRWWHF